MLVRTFGATLLGVEGVLVSVEVDAGRGLPAFHIVGQADRVVAESRDRIRAAFRQARLEFPPGRVTVNLAPTDLPKTGSALDLPIALGIAATRIRLPDGAQADTLYLGELGLDGRLGRIRGALSLVAVAPPAGIRRAIVPLSNLGEASFCPDLEVMGAADLAELLGALRSGTTLATAELRAGTSPAQRESREEPDLRDVWGQQSARRALEVAAAGGHNLLLSGPPGSGKTLLARRLPGILPPLSFTQALEATRIHSVAGLLGARSLVTSPPLRAPHHTTSEVGMIGGGRPIRPGEISLAHRGVLFLDELPEFRRSVLAGLRQPLEEGEIRVVRGHGSARLPARFQLVGAMNPCPCGYAGDPSRECRCDDGQLRRYRTRISGPLLDRIDLHVAVTRVPWRALSQETSTAEASATVRERILAARERQSERYRESPYCLNAELPLRRLRRDTRFGPQALAVLERAVEGLGLSARAFVRVLRVARTLADLEGEESVETHHIAEAIGYRQFDADPAAVAGARGPGGRPAG